MELEELKKSYYNGFKMEKIYEDRVDNTFKYRDNNNCKRTLKAIENLRKR